MKALRIGTRGSALALWQARSIARALREATGVEPEIVIIKTSGDKFQQTSFSQIGTKGIFIKELEDALLDARIDLAVHSMKDVPTEIPEGLTIAAIGKREDVRDALLSSSGATLAIVAARRASWHEQLAPPVAVALRAARFAHARTSRKRGHADREAEARRLRRDCACQGGARPPGLERKHQRKFCRTK